MRCRVPALPDPPLEALRALVESLPHSIILLLNGIPFGIVRGHDFACATTRVQYTDMWQPLENPGLWVSVIAGIQFRGHSFASSIKVGFISHITSLSFFKSFTSFSRRLTSASHTREKSMQRLTWYDLPFVRLCLGHWMKTACASGERLIDSIGMASPPIDS